jgi:hypothetical protein
MDLSLYAGPDALQVGSTGRQQKPTRRCDVPRRDSVGSDDAAHPHDHVPAQCLGDGPTLTHRSIHEPRIAVTKVPIPKFPPTPLRFSHGWLTLSTMLPDPRTLTGGLEVCEFSQPGGSSALVRRRRSVTSKNTQDARFIHTTYSRKAEQISGDARRGYSGYDDRSMSDIFVVCDVRLARRRPEHQRLPARDGNDRVTAGSRPPADRKGDRPVDAHLRINRFRPFASILEPRRPDHISPTHRRATPAAASAGHCRSARWRVLMLR